MITATKYIRPNITIESINFGLKKFYIYNDKGIHYRVFDSFKNLQTFYKTHENTWNYECETDEELDNYLNI